MIACIIFVFGALLEYTVILLKLKLKKVRAPQAHHNGSVKNGQSKSERVSGRRPDRYSHTDLVFLCLFPILFLIFNMLYWTAVYWWRGQMVDTVSQFYTQDGSDMGD